MKVSVCAVLLGSIVLETSAIQAASSEEVVVTATRTELGVDKLAAATTIITRQDIENLQVNSLPDLLMGIAGIDVSVSGGYGKVSDVRMRGTESDHVLVLVDGVRIGSATVGTTAIEHIPLPQIERIEIVRGPRSSLWGSEAIGGVIYIFTRKGSGAIPRYTLQAGAGSYDTAEVSAGVSGEYNNFNYSGSFSWFDSAGFDAAQATSGLFGVDQPDRDGYDNLALHFRGGYDFGDSGDIEAFVLHAEGMTEFDGNFQDTSDFVQQVAGGSLRLKPLENWQTILRLSHSRDDNTNFTPAGSLASVFDTRRLQLSWQNDIQVIEDHAITLGLDYRSDEIDSNNIFAQTARDNIGIFALYSGNFGGHQLIASLRRDDDEVFGDKTTGAVGWSFTWRDWLRLYASYGSAYKTPSFNELFFPGFGNPALGPETADSFEAGLGGGHTWLDWNIRAYHTEVKGLIVTVFDPVSFNFFPDNVDKAEITGVEAELTLRWQDWEALLAMEYLDPENGITGNRLPRRVKERLSLDLNRNFEKYSFGGRLLVEGHRFDDAGNLVRVSGFATMDLRADYRVSDSITVRAKLANLFDQDYQTIATFNSPGRNFFLSFQYQSR